MRRNLRPHPSQSMLVEREIIPVVAAPLIRIRRTPTRSTIWLGRIWRYRKGEPTYRVTRPCFYNWEQEHWA